MSQYTSIKSSFNTCSISKSLHELYSYLELKTQTHCIICQLPCNIIMYLNVVPPTGFTICREVFLNSPTSLAYLFAYKPAAL